MRFLSCLPLLWCLAAQTATAQQIMGMNDSSIKAEMEATQPETPISASYDGKEEAGDMLNSQFEVDVIANSSQPTEIDMLTDNPTLDSKDTEAIRVLGSDPPPQNLFAYHDGNSRLAPPRFVDVNGKPIPTNKWWGNFIANDANAKLEPAWSNPYAIRPGVASGSPFGLVINYPFAHRFFGGSSGNAGASKYFAHGWVDEVSLTGTEFNSPPSFRVKSWDDMGVNLEMTQGNAKLEASLVSGMVYVSARYTNLTPRIVTAGAIISATAQNTKYVIKMNNGQTWVVYSSSPINWRADGTQAIVSTSGPFNGMIRVALVPNDSVMGTLDRYSSCVVKGGNVVTRDASSFTIQWQTEGDCSQGLLHFAQPHHLNSLDRSSCSQINGLQVNSATHGMQQAFACSQTTWQLTEPESIPVDFYPPRKADARYVSTIKDTLVNDIRANWNIPLGGSYYFNGKAAQKYASLCLMANDDAIIGSGDKSLLQECLRKLENVVSPMLTNSWSSPLVYDTVYRGIVSSEGFKKNDKWVDFGNTVYNDHHYHYGYWIVTAAIINYLDASWSRLGELNRVIDFLVRDVANPSADDQYFPKFRNFDWYRGHSYSHGVTPFADGKDQESTSEEINFHYGLALYGRVRGNPALENQGKLMVKLNARSIKMYFLMTNSNTVQPQQILRNHVTGIFFDNKADYATWFSPEKYCINGIQMLPFTPITEFVRTREFVQQEWDDVLSHEKIVTGADTSNGWLSLLYTNYATVNKDAAMGILGRTNLDDGLSRAWALYIAATRP